jgi:thiol:disulfide interchange protein DsbD
VCHLPVSQAVKLDSHVLPIGNDFNWLGLFILLGIGLLLAFTPCVLPMVPIITSIVVGKAKSKTHGFILALAYVLGMSAMYAVLGIIITSIGLSFQIFFQQSWVIMLTAMLFLLLALSMFGLFEIKPPASIINRLYQKQSNIQSGGIISSFILGVIASLIMSPCTSAPLIGVLTTIAQTGDVVYGGLALFALGLGMGVPLIFIAIGLNHFVPKAGSWMQEIKVIFGFAMLIMAIYLLARILPNTVILPLYLTLLAAYFFYLINLSTWAKKIISILRRLLSIFVICLWVICILLLSINHKSSNHANSTFPVVHSQKALVSESNTMLKSHRYVLLDYFAHWCQECAKLEAVMIQPSTQKFLKDNGITLLKVDVSEYDGDSKELADKGKIYGLPTLVLIDQTHNEVMRVSGALSQSQLEDKLTSATKTHTISHK